MPDENNIIARDPRILLLLLLPLLLLGLLFGRKRYYASREFLDSAAASGDLRMAAAVYKRIHVLPEVYADYASVAEEGVAIREYLREVTPAADLAEADATQRLAGVAKPTGAARLLLPRVRVLTVDDAQATLFAEAQLKTITADEFRSEYAVVGEDKGSAPE